MAAEHNRPTLSEPYLVLRVMPGYTAAYLHVRTGAGRAARRRLLETVRVPIRLTRDALPDVLRAVAAELQRDAADRWQPPS